MICAPIQKSVLEKYGQGLHLDAMNMRWATNYHIKDDDMDMPIYALWEKYSKMDKCLFIKKQDKEERKMCFHVIVDEVVLEDAISEEERVYYTPAVKRERRSKRPVQEPTPGSSIPRVRVTRKSTAVKAEQNATKPDPFPFTPVKKDS